MASASFEARGGSDPEYGIYQALFRTGRKEDRDFVFSSELEGLFSFVVFNPPVAIRVGQQDLAIDLEAEATVNPGFRFVRVEPEDAVAQPDAALAGALGG